ncbi:hypothetical protein M9Y10_031028 [Tritrichomonas musculus]|uniref:F5/8 type C domain-containing protein n=1 Tax=Tritrichomonas musculus TaxID=1915356 RepID=A0ABR2H2F4_9EUKA
MCSKKIILSSSGLKNIVLNAQDLENEFIFIFGNREIKLHRLFAEFISPKVSHIHQCDPTINYLNLSDLFQKITTTNTKNISDLFNERTAKMIEAISQGYPIDIEEKDINTIQIISAIFENEELFDKINDISQKVIKNQKNIEDIITNIQIYDVIRPEFVENYISSNIEYINEHFSSIIEKVDLSSIQKSVFSAIIRNDGFKVTDNDKLFEMIKKINSNDGSVEMYEAVDFLRLSTENFCELLKSLDYSEMTGTMWSRLCEFVCSKLASKSEEKVATNNESLVNIEYDGDTSHRFSGLVNYVIKNKKNNESNDDVIQVTASSVSGTEYPKNAIDFGSNNCFHSSGGYPWLQYDFKGLRIRPTSYSIKTRSDQDSQNPMNWNIEVSNTGNENDWKTIDSRTNVTSVSKSNQSDTFNIQSSLSPNESYRYIRFRCTGNTSGNCTCLVLSCLEYFGSLIK